MDQPAVSKSNIYIYTLEIIESTTVKPTLASALAIAACSGFGLGALAGLVGVNELDIGSVK
jgi:hypothetical protein